MFLPGSLLFTLAFLCFTRTAGLVDLPDGEKILTKARKFDWTEKIKYQYLMTLPGGWSSQWRVYQDFIAGGVIVRFTQDKREYWNYDIYERNPSPVVNAASVESVDDAIYLSLNQSETMANGTKTLACKILQIPQIELYGQDFLDGYSEHFKVQPQSNTSYQLEKYGSWKPVLIDAATVLDACHGFLCDVPVPGIKANKGEETAVAAKAGEGGEKLVKKFTPSSYQERLQHLNWRSRQCDFVRSRVHANQTVFPFIEIPPSDAEAKELFDHSLAGIRIAVIHVWSSEERKPPPFFQYWLASALDNSLVADFFLFVPDEQTAAVLGKMAPKGKTNIRIEVVGDFVELYRSRIGPILEAAKFELTGTTLSRLKPMLGYVFEKYILEYSHWAWADMDMVYGNLRKFLSAPLVEGYDIISLDAVDDKNGKWEPHMCTKYHTVSCISVNEGLCKAI